MCLPEAQGGRDFSAGSWSRASLIPSVIKLDYEAVKEVGGECFCESQQREEERQWGEGIAPQGGEPGVWN